MRAAMKPLTHTAVLLLVSLFLLLQGKGTIGQAENCTLSKIKVSTHRESRSVEGVRVLLVVISNVCWCPQSNITLSCAGFKSMRPVDAAALRPIGDGSACLVNGGDAVSNGSPAAFYYAWPSPYRFKPLTSEIEC